MTKIRVIIDTDPGLDDAVAILYALQSGRFDLIGLTTVAGNLGIAVTTRNAGRLAALMNRPDVPVIAGAAAPLTRMGINEAGIHGDDGLGGVSLPEPLLPPVEAQAHVWMAERLRKQPAQTIDILALGPLTNLALLLRDDPAAASRIRRVIMMGGVINDKGNVGPHSEFNFACDPEAAALVLATMPNVVIVPLDVTRKVRADTAYLDSLHGTSVPANAAANLISAYFKDGRESRPLHDPCVLLYAVAPELFTARRWQFSIDLSDGPDAGALVRNAEGPMITVLMDVDVSGALDMLRHGLA